MRRRETAGPGRSSRTSPEARASLRRTVARLAFLQRPMLQTVCDQRRTSSAPGNCQNYRFAPSIQRCSSGPAADRPGSRSCTTSDRRRTVVLGTGRARFGRSEPCQCCYLASRRREFPAARCPACRSRRSRPRPIPPATTVCRPPPPQPGFRPAVRWNGSRCPISSSRQFSHECLRQCMGFARQRRRGHIATVRPL